MNDPDFDRHVRRALGNVMRHVPDPAPSPVRDHRLRPESRHGGARLMGVAAAGLVMVGVVAVAVSDRRSNRSPDSATASGVADIATNDAATIDFVSGEATCGRELPVDVSVPGSSGPVPGPAPGAATPTPTDGQWVAHWDGDFGTVEIRWPADDRVLYDLTGEFADSDISPRYVQYEMASDGGFLTAKLEVLTVSNGTTVNIEPLSQPLIELRPGPGEGDAAPPCDVIEVRYLASEGWHLTAGYFYPELAGNYSVRDLSPLIVSTESIDTPPSPDNVTPCDADRGVQGGTSLGNDVAPTPAEALAAYLGDPAADGYLDSGYHEYVTNDGVHYVYTRAADYDPDMVVTLITVDRDGDGWSVSSLYHSGC